MTGEGEWVCLQCGWYQVEPAAAPWRRDALIRFTGSAVAIVQPFKHCRRQ